MTQEIESDMPKFVSGTYKLSDEAIKAVEDKVRARFEYLMNSKAFDNVILKRYQEQLDKYMMKQYPDLSNRVNQMSLDLNDQMKKFDSKLKDLIVREKKMVKSESIYEDVFLLKDELKKIKEFVDGLRIKMKKAFDL